VSGTDAGLFAAAELWAGLTPGPEAEIAIAAHVADTALALALGWRAKTGGGLLFAGDWTNRLSAAVAAARSTEIDDIHRAACVTAGAVIVPVVLAMLEEELGDPAHASAAVTAGYDAMVSIAKAASGPGLLSEGVLPTLRVAPMGAAVAAARLLGLGPETMAMAIAAAASATTGRPGHPVGNAPWRWRAVGEAARTGMIAALGAEAGLTADPKLVPPMGRPIGEGAIMQTSFKPFCAARQTLSAIQGFREILPRVDPATITRIRVAVPSATRAMIAAPFDPGGGRMGSIASLAYHLNLCLGAPARLHDIVRTPFVAGVSAVEAMLDIEDDPDMDRMFPEVWPARVLVIAAGQAHEALVTHAEGDPESGYGRAELQSKFAGHVEMLGAPVVSRIGTLLSPRWSSERGLMDALCP